MWKAICSFYRWINWDEVTCQWPCSARSWDITFDVSMHSPAAPHSFCLAPVARKVLPPLSCVLMEFQVSILPSPSVLNGLFCGNLHLFNYKSLSSDHLVTAFVVLDLRVRHLSLFFIYVRLLCGDCLHGSSCDSFSQKPAAGNCKLWDCKLAAGPMFAHFMSESIYCHGRRPNMPPV